MPNRNLNADELKRANELLADIRERLTSLAGGDPLLLFAYRRKVVKELGYGCPRPSALFAEGGCFQPPRQRLT
jgi:hypothetical protein